MGVLRRCSLFILASRLHRTSNPEAARAKLRCWRRLSCFLPKPLICSQSLHSMWDHSVPKNMASSWRRGHKPHALYMFNYNAIGEGFYIKFAKPKIVSPTAMAKLAIDSDRVGLESPVINREICIPNREIGRFSLFYQKSGDLPQNRETWKLWYRLHVS